MMNSWCGWANSIDEFHKASTELPVCQLCTQKKNHTNANRFFSKAFINYVRARDIPKWQIAAIINVH